MPIRLAMVDGHTLTRYGLRHLLSQHPDIDVVGECASAGDAATVVRDCRPDVLTIDVSLPDGDGLQLAQRLRESEASLGVVMLASHDDDSALFRALEAGMSAFVAKTAPIDEVLAAIRHAAVAASSFTASGLAGALARRREVQDRLTLSPREMEVLRLLRDGLSVPALAQAMFISQSTAKTYVARLYDKLGAANRAQALMTAVRCGLIRHDEAVPPPITLPRPRGRSRQTDSYDSATSQAAIAPLARQGLYRLVRAGTTTGTENTTPVRAIPPRTLAPQRARGLHSHRGRAPWMIWPANSSA